LQELILAGRQAVSYLPPEVLPRAMGGAPRLIRLPSGPAVAGEKQ